MKFWKAVNQAMIAKSLGELSFEQVLGPVEGSPWRLELKSGVVYEFEAWRGVWDHPRVRPESVRRDGVEAIDAGQFFIDAKAELGMSDITLGCFLEEMHQTLHSDVRIREKQAAHTAAELSDWDGERLQAILDGHPKLLLNKGRLGWGLAEMEVYAPESESPVQLRWLAVRGDRVTASGARDVPGAWNRELLRRELDPAEFRALPVHPWQWDRYVRIQFASELESGRMIDLGELGDLYRPQISLRTLTNVSRPGAPDLKLPLSILNTSAVRGIPGRYVERGPELSAAVARLCREDVVLKDVGVLEESSAISYRHPLYSQIEGAPYRYRELLGAIWRQSTETHLESGEKAILAGSLFHRDSEGRSLIGAYVARSGLSIQQWLRAYFGRVVVPLYHLQVRYGLGLVAHGQNVVVRLRDHRPAGLLLKDFQGDLRLAEGAAFEGFDLDRLPKRYLIHDLITGHFVTTLRFVSETLQECDGFDERDFYRELASAIRDYVREHAGGKVPEELDLLRPRLERVLVNSVRFRIGYADSAERPKPILGEPLENPLCC